MRMDRRGLMAQKGKQPGQFLLQHYEKEAYTRVAGNVVIPRMNKVIALLSRYGPPVERLLDIGCGIGEITLYLKEALQAHEAYGVEVSGPRVAVARERGVAVSQVDLNVEQLPFPDHHFDAVWCGEVLEHVINPDHLLREIGRVLTPRGVCVLTTPNLGSWYNRVFLLLGWQPDCTSVSLEYPIKGRPSFFEGQGDEALSHLRVYTYRGLAELLRLHSFQILKATGLRMKESQPSPTGPRSWASRVLRPVVRGFDGVLGTLPSLTSDMMVAFRKAPTTESPLA